MEKIISFVQNFYKQLMLTLKTIREQTAFVIERLAVKNFDATEIIKDIIKTDDERKSLQTQLDNCLAEQNSIARQIGTLMKEGKKEEAESAKRKTTTLKEQSKVWEQQLVEKEKKLNDSIVLLPNLPNELVPKGRSAEDNVIVREGGEKPELKQMLPHWELTKKYNIIDFDLGVKLTGAGFPVYKGLGAKLQRALIAFFLEKNTAAGYMEVQPPLMVNEASGFGTGNLPDKEGQMYHVPLDNFYLIPTAEIPVTNIYRDVILNPSELPVKLTAYTPCFRREAGSYGKDVRGLNRLHQFDKVEIVQFQLPENSYQALDEMVAHVESIVKALGLPYRILRLCGGDMSFTSALTYDFEVYSAAQERWLEVSSVSNFESFQANRMKARYRDENKKTQLVHTLNGSSLALPRIMAAMLENFQTPDGIRIPDVLQPFMGCGIIG
jgi:seryl-tRNA synthetase